MSMRSPRSRAFTLFRLGPIEIAIHPSWFITFGIVAVVAHSEMAPGLVDADGGLAPLVSIGIALLFYAFILMHELSHAIVARGHGIDARRITLFLLGGVAQIGAEAQRPGHEFRIAVAGPLASLLIAGVLAAISRILHPATSGLPGIWGDLAALNLILALFNLVPAFPLDGGRLLRAGLWAALRDRVRATRWAANLGKGFAFTLVGAGGGFAAAKFASGNRYDALTGIWYVVLGSFLFSIAGAAGRAEGGAVPRMLPPASPGRETERPPAPRTTVSPDEGQAAEPDPRR